MPRKGSVSSVSSQAPSFKPASSAGQPSLSSPSSLSRSTSHLALRSLKLKHSIGMKSSDTVGLRSLSPTSPTTSAESATPSMTGDPEIDDDPELVDIRKRREDLVARYTARLEFLRAKLKGAELHEKLLKK
ncbi:hypothetical protein NLJ89_g9979 [Agrocybe chaxingu]|uniref:Uncharacterized protein n=1 Tax=Agrocybe chaxingu TaxID=84603 RepID=A0A9W8JSI7_9AGAR|nr:hypothetical protein NLJ89_g9979 [Agrocybe chaxingu]